MTINLPSSWSITLLREVVTCISQNEKKLKQKEYQEHGKYPVIDQGQVFIGGYSDDKNLLLDFVPPVIVFGDHTKVKKFVNFNFIVGADGIKILKPLKCFDPKLFFYFLHCIKFVDKGYARHYQHLIKEHIPLPPLPEQHRIVAKLEELFSQLDIAVEALRKAKQQIKAYKQSVLAASFSGKLTSSMQNVECKMQNEETGLPEGWKWVKISNVAEVNPRLPNKEFINPELEVQFLPMKLVEEVINKIHLNEIKKLSEVKKGSYTPFIDSDIIFAKVTPCMENGKMAVVTGLKNGIGYGSSEFHVIRCSNLIFNKYLFFNLIQEKYRSEAKNSMTGAVGLRRVPRQFIENSYIPLPNIEEQMRIVDEIETRFYEAENLEKTIDMGLVQAESLRQSILKKAFEGRLVPQDPNDEPASVLLERIKKCKM